MAPRTQRTTRRKPKAKSRIPLAASTVLPNEIWSEILGYLWKNELKIVRSVGDRHLETLASSLLYRTAYVAARREVLDIFIHLSAHPTIRHFVKEVIYDSSWFDPPEGASQMRDGRYRITDSCADLAVAQLFQNQEQIQTEELITCLRTAFTALTNVKRVVYMDLSRTAGLSGDKVDPEAQPLSNRIFSGFRTGYSCTHCPDPNIGIRLRDYHVREIEGIRVLMLVLSWYKPTTFCELSIGQGVHSSDTIAYNRISHGVGTSHGGIPVWFFEANAYLPVFRRLRKIDLTISQPHRNRTSDSLVSPPTFSATSARISLKEHLTAASELEEIRLSGHISTLNLDLASTLDSGTTWPKLRVVELKYFTATSNDLTSFLLRQLDTLKAVTLDFFDLIDNGPKAHQSWENLTTLMHAEMPNIKFTLGWTWINGNYAFCKKWDDDEDKLWLPRKKEDRWNDDDLVEDSEIATGEERISDGELEGSEEELEWDSGSEGMDGEDLDAEFLKACQTKLFAGT